MPKTDLAFKAVRSARTKALDIFETAFLNLKQNNWQGTEGSLPKEDATRAMSISRLALPFQTDAELREEYINHQGDLRLGLLLEDADALCGFAAYTHCSSMATLPSIVTASMDRLTLSSKKSLRSDQNLQLLASVTATGRSSMNVDLDVATVGPIPTSVVTASFTFVARSSSTYGPVGVPKVEPSQGNARETILHAEGQKRQSLRKNERAKSLNRVPPNAEEQGILHELFTAYKPGSTLIKKHFNQGGMSPAGGNIMEEFGEGGVGRSDSGGKILYKIRDTKMGSISICHPQMRNIHNKVFGGYLMRKAYEIAWTNANLVIGDPNIYLIELDNTFFRYPVEVGSILEFQARSVYSTGNTLSISVHADVINPKTKEKKRTNTFEFCFGVKGSSDSSPGTASESKIEIPEIIPRTYEEGMAYLTARRNLNSMRANSAKEDQLDETILFDLKHYLRA